MTAWLLPVIPVTDSNDCMHYTTLLLAVHCCFQSSDAGFIRDFISDNTATANVLISNLLLLFPRCMDPWTTPLVLLLSFFTRFRLHEERFAPKTRAQIFTFYLKSEVPVSFESFSKKEIQLFLPVAQKKNCPRKGGGYHDSILIPYSIYTCTFICLDAIWLQFDHPKRILTQGVNGVLARAAAESFHHDTVGFLWAYYLMKRFSAKTSMNSVLRRKKNPPKEE